MKIGLVVGEFPKLSETFVLQQITGLIDLGHDVTVFALRNTGESVQHRAVTEYRLRERARYLEVRGWRDVLRGFRRGARAVLAHPSALRYPTALKQRVVHGAQGRFDVLYCHFGHVAEHARQLREVGLFSGPLVAVFHGYDVTVWPSEVKGDALAPLFRDAALLLPISRFWRDKLLQMGADPGKVEVRRMGVDTRALQFRPRSWESTQPVQLVSVGRLVEKKGIAFAVRAVARAQRMLDCEIHYHIVGDGPLREQLAGVARAEGIAKQVTFHGARRSDEVAALLEPMHILLAPSVTAENGDMEGIPVVLMEAMAQGLPVLSTEHSGIPELIQHGHSGYLVTERDADALAEALVSMVRNPAEWLRLTTNARSTIETEFDTQRLTRELAERFSKLSVAR
ncbi:MAG TPA: glycosyltransferase [Polyangiaceae bacterium]